MKDNGTIYGFVGVIGSGKSYQANNLISELQKSNKIVLMSDFSEGIRQAAMNILAGENVEIDIGSREYLYWKNSSFEVPIPANKPIKTDGRLILQRIGEYCKVLAGENVWARYTVKCIYEKMSNLTPQEASTTNIIFGSVRFLYEAEALFDMAELTSKRIKIFFCDYKSPAYELNSHVSENFARGFIEKGFCDGSDITDEVLNMILNG